MTTTATEARNPPLGDKRLREILDAARERDDPQTAELVNAVLWSLDFCDYAADSVVALARECRVVVDSLTSARAVVPAEDSPRIARLREMLTAILDSEGSDTTIMHRRAIPNAHWGAISLVESLRKTAGTALNFAQLKIGTPTGEYIVIIQRPDGKSPADLITELKAENERLKQPAE